MLFEEIKNIKSDKRDLRNFGLVIGAALLIIGGLLFWKEKDTYSYFFVIAGVFAACGLVAPKVLKPLQIVWMTLAVIMGFFMTRLILSVLFYIVFTLIGGIPRLFGRSFLEMKIDKSRESYWEKRKPETRGLERYENQF